MNWRRGGWRLWIVVAALWALPISAWYFGPITEPYVPPQGFTQTSEGAFEVFPDYGDRYRRAENAVGRGELVRVSFTGIASDVIFYGPSDATGISDHRREAIIAYAVQLQTDATNEARSAALANWAYTALVPPLVVLAFGYGLGWALAGFKSSPARRSAHEAARMHVGRSS